MIDIGKAERVTQKRVAKLFVEELGYTHLGDWAERANNSNIEAALLSAYLSGAGYNAGQINAALYKLNLEATVLPWTTLKPSLIRPTLIRAGCMAAIRRKTRWIRSSRASTNAGSKAGV